MFKPQWVLEFVRQNNISDIHLYFGKDCYRETIPTWSFFLWMSLYLNFSEPRGIQLKVQCRDPTYVPISKTTRVNNNLGQSHQTPTLTRHFCNLFGLLRNEICRKRKGRRRRSARVNNPYRKSREMAVIIWLYSATLSQISWNIMALFFHRAQCSMHFEVDPFLALQLPSWKC